MKNGKRGLLGLLIPLLLFVLICILVSEFIKHEFGNFVHDKPASPEYYHDLEVQRKNAFPFNTLTEGNLDLKIDSFLLEHSQYNVPDSILSLISYGPDCTGDCGEKEKLIFFSGNNVREIYVLKYNSGWQTKSGLFKEFYFFKDGQWRLSLPENLSAPQRQRIAVRLLSEVLNNLSRKKFARI